MITNGMELVAIERIRARREEARREWLARGGADRPERASPWRRWVTLAALRRRPRVVEAS